MENKYPALDMAKRIAHAEVAAVDASVKRVEESSAAEKFYYVLQFNGIWKGVYKSKPAACQAVKKIKDEIKYKHYVKVVEDGEDDSFIYVFGWEEHRCVYRVLEKKYDG
jgi:hypothetical protein